MKTINTKKIFAETGLIRGVIATGLIVISVMASTTVRGDSLTSVVVFQTRGGSGPEFISTNSAALGTNCLFMAYATTNSDTSGFNTANPTLPTGGDVLLGAYPLTQSGYPGAAGEISGYLGVSCTNNGSELYTYVAVFDYNYDAYLSGGIPAGTDYALLTNARTRLRSSIGGLPTDMGYVIESAAVSDGAWTTSLRTTGETTQTGHLALASSELTFSSVYGEADPADKKFTIANTGTASLTFNTVTNFEPGKGRWMTFTPASATLAAGSSVTCTVAIVAASPAREPDSYTATCVVTSAQADNSPQLLSVAYTVEKASQVISNFLPVAGGKYTMRSGIAFSAQGGASGNPIMFDENEFPGSWEEHTFTPATNGMLTMTVSQGGNTYYNAAESLSNTYFIASDRPPEIGNLTYSGLTATSVVLSATITATNDWPVLTRGFLYSTNSLLPMDDSTKVQEESATGLGAGKYSIAVTGLLTDVTYYYYGFARTTVGSNWTGDSRSFTPSSNVTASLEWMILLLGN